jgi:two-component system nitrate/nitrite response regulator NarL
MKRIRVLLVDDHLAFRTKLREVLSEADDIEVVGEAANAAEGVRLAKQLRPELVLMDIDMPGEGGILGTAAITRALPDTRVAMLTVSSAHRDLFEALRAGAVGYLSKGLGPEALIRSVRGLHQGEMLISGQMAARALAYFRQGGGLGGLESTEPDAGLSPRENEVLQHIARGRRDRDIAETLVLSEGTVKKHVQNILRKLQARNRAEAAAWAARVGQ